MGYGAQMAVPQDRRYSVDHQWIMADGNAYRVGLTDFAQEALGEVTLVRFADAGATVTAGAEMGEVEAFKAMTDLYMPVEATILAANPRLGTEPTIVNTDPYGEGWLCRVQVERPNDLESLLDAGAYSELIGA